MKHTTSICQRLFNFKAPLSHAFSETIVSQVSDLLFFYICACLNHCYLIQERAPEIFSKLGVHEGVFSGLLSPVASERGCPATNSQVIATLNTIKQHRNEALELLANRVYYDSRIRLAIFLNCR